MHRQRSTPTLSREPPARKRLAGTRNREVKVDDFTKAEIVAVLTVDSAEARKHARCGAKSRCRLDALAKCDEDLDALLALAVRDLRTMVTGPIHGG